MAWVVSVSVDTDKTANPAVGTASAVFTDTDNTTFTFSARASFTAANATAFVNAAVAARNAWLSRKTVETNALNVLVADFTTAGETATATAAT